MMKAGTIDDQETAIIQNHVKNPLFVKRLYGEDAVLKHLKSDLKIIVRSEEIQKQQRGSPGFINGKAVLMNDRYGFNGKVEVTCRVACGKLYLLKNHIRDETINILDHLDLLFPNFDSIGLFTFQNGIQNGPADFENMGNKIIGNLPEIPLCIGFYNETNGLVHGIIDDLKRFSNEWHLNASSIMILRQTLVAFFKILSNFKSRKVWWTHIAHSEAGLIANEVLTTKNYSIFQQYVGMDNFLNDHLITLSYGAVEPIPNVVHEAINNYSRDDITMRYARKYLDKFPKPAINEDKNLKEVSKGAYDHWAFPKSHHSEEEIFSQLKAGTDQVYISEYPHKSTKNGCTVTIIESLVPKSKQPLIEKDHAFDGATYQNELNENIKFLRNKFGIHDCR